MPFSFKPQPTTPSEGTTPQDTSSTQTLGLSPNFSNRVVGSGGFFQKILYLILGLMVILTISLFAYQWFLKSQIKSKQKVLEQHEAKLSALPLDDMRAVSNRLKVVSQLLKNHTSVNAAFDIIENSIENPVTYTRFDLRYDESRKMHILQLGAVAPDYKSIVQQMETFKNKPYSNYISKVTIGGLTPDDTGRVIFNLTMEIAIAGVLPESLLFNAPTAEASTINSTSSMNTASTTITASSSINSNINPPSARQTLPLGSVINRTTP